LIGHLGPRALKEILMQRHWACLVAMVLATAVLLLGGAEAQAQHGRFAGYHGPYRGYPYGWYRPYGYYPHYWHGPFVGIGVGFYVPYYGSYAYPLAPGVVYPPVVAYSSPEGSPPADGSAGRPPAEKPPPDNAGHLQLIVPDNAEVYIDGTRIAQTGTTREIVSPPVTPGTRYSYKISVRYTDPSGKAVDDTREIRFQANDWFSIDFTRPAPPQAPAVIPAQPQLRPVPPAEPR
jgi:uncharacterized protein (TIGR03000 family)